MDFVEIVHEADTEESHLQTWVELKSRSWKF